MYFNPRRSDKHRDIAMAVLWFVTILAFGTFLFFLYSGRL